TMRTSATFAARAPLFSAVDPACVSFATMKSHALVLSLALAALPLFAQQPTEQQRSRRTPQAPPPTQPSTPQSTEPEPPARARQMEQEQQQPARERAEQPQEQRQAGGAGGATSTSFRFDMKETAPNVT